MTNLERELNCSNDEIDILSSIAFLWSIRLYILTGLTLGAGTALIYALVFIREEANTTVSEIQLGPSTTQVVGVNPPIDGLENYLFGPEGSRVFKDYLRKTLTADETDKNDVQDIRTIIKQIKYDDNKFLRVTLNVNEGNRDNALSVGVVAALNEAIHARNENVRGRLVELEGKLFSAMQDYSASSYQVIRLAQSQSRDQDQLFLVLLEAAANEGLTSKSIEKILMLASIIPESNPQKSQYVNALTDSFRTMTLARENLDSVRSKEGLQSNFQIWKIFELKSQATLTGANQPPKNIRVFQSVLIGVMIGGLIGSLWGGLFLYWKSNKARIQLAFQNKLAQKTT